MQDNENKLKCLVFDLEIPYLSTFRKPLSTISILTYNIPPFTTIQGLLANAFGMERDKYYN
ncbi:MAG: CRISPR-associated protein Cas5, partial [Candidatus Aenigmarchaeota archaeon]|nr:CRISPR-associated protein Cas5 [Candidatus Aenigmarchaeota archaeon]